MNNTEAAGLYVGNSTVKQVNKGSQMVLAPNGDQVWYKANERPSLDLQFASKKSLKDQVSNTEKVTHTRASSATYVDGNGVIKDAVTNLLIYSEDFTNNNWPTNSRATLLTDTGVDNPFGGTNASTWKNGGTSSTELVHRAISNGTSGIPYTYSVWLRRRLGTGNVIMRVGDNIAQNVTSQVTTEWNRIQVTNEPTTNTVRAYIEIHGFGDEIDVWGAQLEQAASAGEYVKTTSTINSTPRFDHDPATGESLGLLVEEARTNLLKRSSFNAEGALAALTRTSTTEINPAGEAETRRIECTSGPGAHRISFASSSTNTVTVSAFVKKDTHRYVNFGYGGLTNSFTALFDIEPGLTSDRLLGQDIKGSASTNISAGYQDYSNGWVRIWATGTTSGTNGFSLQLAQDATAFSLNNWDADGTEAIYVWGGQLEDDASFPTSLILTDGAAVTRAADVTEITGNDFGTFNLIEYSEEFDQWSGPGPIEVKPNQALAPNGTFTADELDYTSGSGVPYISRTVSVSTPTSFSVSLYVKTNDADSTVIRVREGSGVTHNTRLNINLSANSVTTIDQGAFSTSSSSMTAVGNGWYRVSASIAVDTNTLSSYTSLRYEIYYDAFATISSDQGSFYVWGAQIEGSSTVTPYVKSDVTFTSRASTATYYDANGVIQTAAVDEARASAYLPDGVTGNFVSAGKLLLEPAKTNLVRQSEDFVTTWTPDTDFTFSKTAAAPDGTNNATIFTPTTTSSLKRQKITCVISNLVTHTYSIYAKANGYNRFEMMLAHAAFNTGGANIRARYQLDTETVHIIAPGTNTTGSIENVGDGWYRCIFTSDATAISSSACQVRVADENNETTYAGDGTSGMIFWGAQLEEGSVATSYIPSTGGTTTRAADVSSSSANTLGNSFYKQSEGTLFAISQTPVPTGNYSSVVNIGSPTEPFALSLQRNLADSRGFGASTTSDNTASTGSGTGSFPVNTFVSQAFAGKENDFALCTGGGSINADTNTDVMPLPQYMYIGSQNGSNKISTFHFKRITYWPQRLPDATLQTITS